MHSSQLLQPSADPMDQQQVVPEISPLHSTPSTYVFNEVCDFQMGIKHNITLYPIFKGDW